MTVGIKFSAIKVENNLICDGHHRYIAAVLSNFNLEIVIGKVNSATNSISWESIIFEEEDWDTIAKIKMLNEQDADFNNIEFEKIIEILK